MAGYKVRTLTGNILITQFTFLAISNLSDSANVDLKYNATQSAESYYRLLPLQSYTFPLLGSPTQMLVLPGGAISIFTDGIITPQP